MVRHEKLFNQTSLHYLEFDIDKFGLEYLSQENEKISNFEGDKLHDRYAFLFKMMIQISKKNFCS